MTVGMAQGNSFGVLVICTTILTNTSHLVGATKAPHRCDVEVVVLIQ